MYLPRVEMRQWKGMWYCPYCFQELMEEEQRREERIDRSSRKTHKPGSSGPEIEPTTPKPPPAATPQVVETDDEEFKCDKCGRTLSKIYILADHKFCPDCFNAYKEKIEKQGLTMPPYLVLNQDSHRSFLGGLLHAIKKKITASWRKKQDKGQEIETKNGVEIVQNPNFKKRKEDEQQ